jgi:pantoate--beta-alanine ligase
MGALHAGHMALVEAAKARAEHLAATIFVNPMQFGEGEDLGRYPRQEQQDTAMLEAAGCDLLWLPSAEDIYPDGFATRISVSGVARRWEGEARPGHFDGVATVVAKLLLAVAPDVALFGEKDFQQLAVIRRMVQDLAIPVQIAGVATVGRRTASLCPRATHICQPTSGSAQRRFRARSQRRPTRSAAVPTSPRRWSRPGTCSRRQAFRGSTIWRWWMPAHWSRSSAPKVKCG